MNFFKNLFIGIIVMAISSGIFYLLQQDRKEKNNFLSSTLNSIRDELADMVPKGKETELFGTLWDQFINKVKKRELSQAQVEMTAARAFNMQMRQEKLSRADIQAVMAASLDTPRAPKLDHHTGGPDDKGQPVLPKPFDEEYLAFRVRHMMALKNNIVNVSQDDSIGKELIRHTMFTADSGLQMVIDADFSANPLLQQDPRIHRLFKELSEKDGVKIRKFKESADIAEQALLACAPFLPPSLCEKIIIEGEYKLIRWIFTSHQ